jgi:hypothetical protein
MNKIIQQKNVKILKYEQILKNDNLKKKGNNIKKIIFDNKILYTNAYSGMHIIEINNYENLYIPITVLNIKDLYTIESKFKNSFLFNYNLNYNIIYNFNKIILKQSLLNNQNKIKGRIVGGTNKKTLILILGIVFSMNPRNLSKLINNKKLYYKLKYKFEKKKKPGKFHFKQIQPKQLVNCYKLRYINFKIDRKMKSDLKYKMYISRLLYITDIVNNQNKKKYVKKSTFYRKPNVSKKNKKK